MRTIWILPLLLAVLLYSCSFQTAGTGHEGEAKVMGSVVDANNSPVENCTLTIARDDYASDIPNKNRSLDKPQKSIVSDGKFSFDVFDDAKYTISGTKGDQILYMSDIVVNEGTNSLGTLQLKKAIEVPVFPSLGDSLDSSYVVIEGTDWIFSIGGKEKVTILLPPDSLTIYHHEKDSIDTLNVKITDGFQLGDSLGWEAPAISMDDTVTAGSKVTLTIESFQKGDVYMVDWGDLQDDMVINKECYHTYEHMDTMSESFEVSVIKVGVLDSAYWKIDTSDWKDTADWKDTSNQKVEGDWKDTSDWVDTIDWKDTLGWVDTIDWKDVPFFEYIIWDEKIDTTTTDIDTTSEWYQKSVSRKKITVLGNK